MSLSPPVKITVPFATSGLKNPIPQASDLAAGRAGYDQGFPAINMTPKPAGGIPPFGQDFNGIFFDVTTAIQYLEAGGSFPYDSAFATAVGGYPLGALVSRTDGLGLWRNTVANNTTDPEAFGAGWLPDGGGNAAITMTNANVTLTALQAANPIITISGVMTANLNLIFPVYAKQWLVVNKATGAFSVTAKTAAGSGVVIPTGNSQLVYGDGTNIVLAQVGPVSGGQVQLQFVSATSIKLAPLGGNYLAIAGAQRQIPSAGVTLSNATMAANTTYYIYSFWTGTAVSLEFSATGHAQDPATGIEVKSGDITRSLVGMIRTDASSQFTDNATSRLVASWFNRRDVAASITTSGTLTFTAGTPTEISTAVRLLFLTWGNESVDIRLTGQYTNNTATQSTSVQSYVDGAAYGNASATYIPAANVGMTYASTNNMTAAGALLSEGFHTAGVFGSVTAGTGATNTMAHSLTTRI